MTYYGKERSLENERMEDVVIKKTKFKKLEDDEKVSRDKINTLKTLVTQALTLHDQAELMTNELAQSLRDEIR